MIIFDKINRALTVDIYEMYLKEQLLEVFLVNVLKVRTLHKYVLHSERNITGNACWLVFAGEQVRMHQAWVTNFQSFYDHSFTA